ncbi:hypothetical protein FACS189459_3820 [Bacilli bacterium]|nr:hypothetical protein FACS189459_3820 [Bacilli bacterium]
MNIRLICTITSVTISCFSIGSILTTVFVASSPSKLSINMGGLTSIDYDPDSTYAIGNGKVTYSIYPKHTIYTVK